jgi:chitinase
MRQTHSLRAVFALFVGAFALLASVRPAFGQPAQSQGKILAGYFEEWSIYYAGYNLANLESNGSAAKLSHLVYAFGDVSVSASSPSTDTCVIADAWADFENNNLPPVGGIADSWPLYGNFAEILKLKQLHPKLKTVISLGGASAAEAQAFSTAAGTAAGRSALVSSCINMFVVGNVGSDWNGNISAPGLFDGFNIDWEFPAAADKHNFTLLLQEFRSQLNALSAQTGKQYTLSFEGPAGAQNYINIELKKAAQQVDFITVDGYNYAGTWESTTNHASPLFEDHRDPAFGQHLDIEDTVSAYLNAGVPPKKYVMGVPLYGAGWTGAPNVNHGLYQDSTGPSPVLLANGTGPCTDLSGDTPGCDSLLTPGSATYATLSTLTVHGYKSYFDLRRIAVTLYDPNTETLYTYDNPDTAFLKAVYIDFRVPGGLGGAFVWAVKDDDAKGTMVKTLAFGLGR